MTESNKTSASASSFSFVRNATGLVRSFSALDAFVVSIAVTAPVYFNIAAQIGFVVPTDPGADVTVSAIIGFFFMVPMGLVYYFLSRAMPRSGGDYVWNSRLLHPAIGFMAGWSMWIAIISLLAGAVTVWASVVLPVFASSLGYAWNIPSLVTFASTFVTPTNIFVAAVLLMIVGVLMNSFGPTVYRRSMLFLTAVVMLSTAIELSILLTSNHTDFVSAFNSYSGNGGNTYNGIISLASSKGWTYAPLATSMTLLSIPLGILLYNGFNYPTIAAGEVKQASRNLFIGVIIALIFSGIVLVGGIYLSINLVGYQFTQAAFSLFAGGNWPLAGAPWMGQFVPMLVHNSVELFLLQLGWVAYHFWFVGAIFLVLTRYVFAFSFDRMFPSALSSINERFHFPIRATLLTIVVAAALVYIAVFTSFISSFLNSVAIWSIVWIITSVSAIILPYTKKKDLNQSMPGGKWPVPLISILGVISLVAMAITFYYAVTTPAVGPSTPSSDAILAAIFVTGLVVYIVSYLYHRSKGINIAFAASEIPPE
jgi:amino acid transporter